MVKIFAFLAKKRLYHNLKSGNCQFLSFSNLSEAQKFPMAEILETVEQT